MDLECVMLSNVVFSVDTTSKLTKIHPLKVFKWSRNYFWSFAFSSCALRICLTIIILRNSK
jgi:hypothetical protein